MGIGGRSVARVARAPLQAAHYRAAAGMLAAYPDLTDCARRYVTGRGTYPYSCRIRTPLGTIAPTVYSAHDMATVNEVFCRRDYRVGRGIRVAVDLGANIGLSALYFATRNAEARVYSWEPDPKNVQRMRRNTARFDDRVFLDEAAVAIKSGTAAFGVEPIGRYGTLELDLPTGHPPTDLISVRTVGINDLLADVLSRHDRIDVLKVDVEGSEEKLVAAIAPEHLNRIDLILYETDGPAPMHRHCFHHSYATETNRLEAR